MSPHPSPLADTVANLRIATLALPARAWVPQAIHALILACLARIFGRLEEMIRLWQAGLLSPPIQRQQTVRTTPTHPGPREARPDSDSDRYFTAAHGANTHARTADRAVQEASNHMETEKRREASEARSCFFSSSHRLHVKLLPPPRARNEPEKRLSPRPRPLRSPAALRGANFRKLLFPPNPHARP